MRSAHLPVPRTRRRPQCECGAFYNIWGQRLRDDLHTRVNPSEYDADIGDLEGDEMSYRGET